MEKVSVNDLAVSLSLSQVTPYARLSTLVKRGSKSRKHDDATPQVGL